MITRAQTQAQELATQAEALGLVPVLFPLLDIRFTLEQLPRGTQLDSFDWLVLTSGNAVRAWDQYLMVQGYTWPDLSSRIAVVGSKTRSLIEERGGQVALEPCEFTAKSLAQALSQYPLKGQKIAYLGGNLSDPTPFVTLEQEGAEVTVFSLYETCAVRPANLNKAKQMFLQRQIDYVSFASGSAVAAFAACFEPEILATLLSQVCLVSIGPSTSRQMNKRLGRVDLEASPHTLEALLNSVKTHSQGARLYV